MMNEFEMGRKVRCHTGGLWRTIGQSRARPCPSKERRGKDGAPQDARVGSYRAACAAPSLEVGKTPASRSRSLTFSPGITPATPAGRRPHLQFRWEVHPLMELLGAPFLAGFCEKWG